MAREPAPAPSMIDILDHGRPLRLEYAGLLAYHGGGALAGAAIGFRAMAAAGEALSCEQPWDRRDLTVTSWHDGPGVLDAIEFVTRTITRGRFSLHRNEGAQACGAAEAFRFEIGDGRRTVCIALREQAVDPVFFQLARTTPRSPRQEIELTRLKSSVAETVIAASIPQLFVLRVQETTTA